jgi:c-di-GMP-binding flagellar brake protein YcgR
VEEDRRVYDRLEVNCLVTFASDAATGEGTMTDVSMGGCNMVTDTHLTNGMIVNMSLQVSSDAAPIVVAAALIRHAGSQPIGVEFLRLADSERERLQQFIRGLLINRER